MSYFSAVPGVFAPFRSRPDEEMAMPGLQTASHKPIPVTSNLDRFRLLVGITTAPSMDWHAPPKKPILATILPAKADDKKPEVTVTERSVHGDSEPASPHTSIHSTPAVTEKDPKAPLKIEYDIISTPDRPAKNRGIYQIVVSKGNQARKSYKYTAAAINFCLGAQIVVAATLTALGAGHETGAIVTVLGAINTVIAGFLTYLKGSGLPGKMKYFQHEWDKIREYIEARERDLRCDDEAFDVHEQVEYIRHLFDLVQKDVDANRSDRFTSPGQLHGLPETTERRNLHGSGTVVPAKAQGGARISASTGGKVAGVS